MIIIGAVIAGVIIGWHSHKGVAAYKAEQAANASKQAEMVKK